ncbi:flagellar protein FlaG [Bacillus sp. H-16]|uniref:flagellar protein FlaG n=1 Tax=Alteribacter salitolerans TaxID=2912333 RepID=UPI0019641770|nr:flagellar protein FlaG [Alteribacter salitolerans]MBM7096856.1 flagellar protein FlaG [Alteribacter salitolerans]
MDVKPVGSMTVNDLFAKVQGDRTENNRQGWSTESERTIEKKKNWSKDELSEKLDTVNKLSDLQNTSVQFQLHEGLDRMFVKIVDRNTQEVVKEIPPEEFLDMISSMLEFAGIIIDEKI